MPAALRFLDLRGFDLVVSSSHCVAKGAHVPPGAPTWRYVHSPMRYMWDRFDAYFGPGRASLPVRLAASASRPALQALGPADRGRSRCAGGQQPARGAADCHDSGAARRTSSTRRSTSRASRQAPGCGARRTGRLLPLARGARPLQAGGPRGGGLPANGAARCGLPATGRMRACFARACRPTCAGWARCPTPTFPGCTSARGRWSSPARRISASPRWRRSPPAARSSPSRGAARSRPSPRRRACSSTPRRRRRLVEALGRFEAFERGFSPARARARAELFSEERFRDAIRRKVEAVIAGRPDLRDRLPW